MVLADLGADVVRVEAPHRADMVRELPPFDGDISAWHAVLNRSKRSLALDLKQAASINIVKHLVQTYDIVIEAFRPGVMDRLGVGFDTLRAANPRLIYCSITGYGQTGPYRDRAGHEINYLALSGAMSVAGRRETGPASLGVHAADIGGGAFGGLIGLLAAVIHRQETGEGQAVDISMLDMMIAWNSLNIAEFIVGGQIPQREGSRFNGGGIYDYYLTKDGRYLAVGALEPKFWDGFCRAIERDDLVPYGDDLTPATQHMLKMEIQSVLGSRRLDEWAAIFASLDVCTEPVLTIPEVLEHPHTKDRALLTEIPVPGGGAQLQISSAIKFSACEPSYRHIGPAIGTHTYEVLKEAGYTEREIDCFQKDGVFG
jgi:crotonobetainyl-CoA:carnitine CoA-transferase CaiB-like acyl-CoA transferase